VLPKLKSIPKEKETIEKKINKGVPNMRN